MKIIEELMPMVSAASKYEHLPKPWGMVSIRDWAFDDSNKVFMQRSFDGNKHFCLGDRLISVWLSGYVRITGFILSDKGYTEEFGNDLKGAITWLHASDYQDCMYLLWSK